MFDLVPRLSTLFYSVLLRTTRHMRWAVLAARNATSTDAIDLFATVQESRSISSKVNVDETSKEK